MITPERTGQAWVFVLFLNVEQYTAVDATNLHDLSILLYLIPSAQGA